MTKDKKKRQLQGVVVSDKMDKTVVVTVSRVKMHSKYQKQYKLKRNYKAHDPKNEYHPGETVKIEETRPLSQGKRWRVVARVK